MRRITTIVATTLGLIAFLSLTSCGDDTATTTEEPPASSESTTPPDDGSDDDDSDDDVVDDDDDRGSTDVGVYFVQAVGEPSAGGVVEAIAATSRTVDTAGAHPGSAAMSALLDGPDEFEAEIGMTTAVPATTEILGLAIAGGTALVDLSGEFETPSGAFTDVLRVAQVVFTLTAFDDVDTVQFEIDGESREIIGSHGVEVGGADGTGLGRDDLPEARPPILVESPAPGGPVTDPLTLAGEANTFEANVRWALTDPDGEIVDEGFLTATAGNGEWGTFLEDVGTGATADRGGLGAVVLWEDSPEDGRQTNLVEVPVTWPEP